MITPGLTFHYFFFFLQLLALGTRRTAMRVEHTRHETLIALMENHIDFFSSAAASSLSDFHLIPCRLHYC